MNRAYIFLVGLFLVSSGVGYAGEREFLMKSGIFSNNAHSQQASAAITTTTENSYPNAANDKKQHPNAINTINTLDTLHIFDNIKTLAQQCKKAKPKKKELLCKSINLFMDEVVERIAQEKDQSNTRINLLRQHMLSVDSKKEQIEQFVYAIRTVSDITQAKLSSSQNFTSSRMQFTSKAENGTYWSSNNPIDQLTYLTYILLPIEIKVHLLQLMWWSLVKKAPHEITTESPSVIKTDDGIEERRAIYKYLTDLKNEDEQSDEPKLTDLVRFFPEICIENGCYYPIMYNHDSQANYREHLNNITTSPDFNACDSNIKGAYAQFLITFNQWLNESQPTEFKKIEYPNVSWMRTQEEITRDLQAHLKKISSNNYLTITNPEGKNYTFDRLKQKVHLQKLKPKIEEAEKNILHTIQLLENNTLALINANETIRLKKINELKEAIENLRKQHDKISDTIKVASNDVPPVIKIIDIPATLIKNDILDKIAALEKKIQELENPKSASSSSSIESDDMPGLTSSSISSEDISAQPPVEPTEPSLSDPIHPADTTEFSLTNLLRSCGTKDLSSEETLAAEEYNPDPSLFTLEKLKEHDQQNNSSSGDTTTITTTQPPFNAPHQSRGVAIVETDVVEDFPPTPPTTITDVQSEPKIIEQEKISQQDLELQNTISRALEHFQWVETVHIDSYEHIGGGLRVRNSLRVKTPDEYIHDLYILAQHAKPSGSTDNNEQDDDIHRTLNDTKHVEFLKYIKKNKSSVSNPCKVLLSSAQTILSDKKYNEFTEITPTIEKERTQIDKELKNITSFVSDEEYQTFNTRIDAACPRPKGDELERKALSDLCKEKYTAKLLIYRKAYEPFTSTVVPFIGNNNIKKQQNHYIKTIYCRMWQLSVLTKGFFTNVCNLWKYKAVINNFERMKKENLIPTAEQDKRIQEIETRIAAYKAKSWWTTITESFKWLFSGFSWAK